MSVLECDEGGKAYLLRMLSDHQHEREIVHPKRGVEEAVGIDEEDDVLDRILDERRIRLFQPKQKPQRSLMVRWRAHNMGSQDAIHIACKTPLFQLDPHSVANARHCVLILRPSPDGGEEEVDMVDLRDLVQEGWDVGEETLEIVRDEDVEVDAVSAAGEEGLAVFASEYPSVR